jgi:hypothetical protein
VKHQTPVWDTCWETPSAATSSTCHEFYVMVYTWQVGVGAAAVEDHLHRPCPYWLCIQEQGCLAWRLVIRLPGNTMFCWLRNKVKTKESSIVPFWTGFQLQDWPLKCAQ